MHWLVMLLGIMLAGTHVGWYRLHARVTALETRNRERDRLVAWRDQSEPQQQHPDGTKW